MKYEVIARRYRPRKFEEVVGQESVAQTLRGAIVHERLAHAYLFAGPRGVGKTSMARIFAKALNCPSAASRSGNQDTWAHPCDACATCQAIHIGQDIDVIELDGASHRGIEDVRAIIDGVSRPAARSPYKVYIIDEVHMLTREAFNALLKTLEEPPRHVKFVIATTEPHKIPETVLSRCQRFDFHPIGEPDIVRRLRQICDAEGRVAEDGLLEAVARHGRGGLRDAQTLLDQLMTFSDGGLSQSDLDRITGRAPQDRIGEITGAVVDGNSAGVLDSVRAVFRDGADPAVLLEQVLEDLHGRLYSAVTSERGEGKRGIVPDVPGHAARHDAEKDQVISVDRLAGLLEILLECATRLRTSSYPEVVVEVALLKLSRVEDPRALDRALERLFAVESSALMGVSEPPRGRVGAPPPRATPAEGRTAPPSGGARASPNTSVSSSAPGTGKAPARSAPDSPSADDAPPAARRSTQPTATAGDAGFTRLRSLWQQVLIEVQKDYPDVYPYLKDAALDEDAPVRSPGGGETGVFRLRFSNPFLHRQLRTARRQGVLENVVREVTGAEWEVQLDLLREGESSDLGPRDATRSESSKLTPQARAGNGPQHESGGLSGHPLVKKSIELFRGKLV